ncbi:MAG: nucleoside kinase [Chloroflexi bacterium]|jgi:uridine kinase|nr:nucleoside kinase [Chloroflexota bacterium]
MSQVWETEPRATAQVRFADDRTFEGPAGTPLSAFIEAAYPQAEPPFAAALVNGELRELTYEITTDVSVTPLNTNTNDGMRIYHRSVMFLFIVAVHELFPQARVKIDHSVTLGGVFCQIAGDTLFTQADVDAIEQRMREIVEAGEPIRKVRIPVEEAKRIFAEQGYDDKVRLLRFRDGAEVTLYQLRGVSDYFYGAMMPNTEALRWFQLELYPPGVILRLPQRQEPTTLPPHRDYPKLMRVFREYGHWLNILGMDTVGSLNEAVENGSIREAIFIAEALHEKRISQIADEIATRSDQVRLVLIAGPSSSGKTTFARRLAIQLIVDGLHPFALGLDDYFVDRELTPRDASGNYDFESLHAINLDLFNEQLLSLMAGEPVRLAKYNFHTGRSEWGDTVQLSPDAVIIVEGIHGLNPNLVPKIPPENIYRVYVSALTQLNIDHHNRVPTTDNRLLRRIVRDAQFRGYSARDTIQRWESVRRGEEENIFPYQENADIMFNSALAYELAVLKPFAEPLLLRVPHGSLEAVEARRLTGFLRWVRPCTPEFVPDNSLLREFVGGSILHDFKF